MREDRIVELRQELDKQLAKLDFALTTISKERKILKKGKEKLAAATEARNILQEVAKGVQEKAHERISRLVTKCLAIVFDEPYSLGIDFVKKRNKTEARFFLMRDGEKFHPTDSSGGGVVDVASFALRLSCIMLRLPQYRRVVILDEPFKHLDASHRLRVRMMLEMLAEELGMQFILSTHMKSLQTGTIIELE